MTDPAVAYVEGYGPYERGVDLDVYLKLPNGSYSLGLVWPGKLFFCRVDSSADEEPSRCNCVSR